MCTDTDNPIGKRGLLGGLPAPLAPVAVATFPSRSIPIHPAPPFPYPDLPRFLSPSSLILYRCHWIQSFGALPVKEVLDHFHSHLRCRRQEHLLWSGPSILSNPPDLLRGGRSRLRLTSWGWGPVRLDHIPARSRVYCRRSTLVLRLRVTPGRLGLAPP